MRTVPSDAMGYSGLIYAAIVAAWLAVLVPRWVRRNEEVERARETDAASGVRVLTRRSGGPIHARHPGAGADDRTIVSGGASGLVLSGRGGVRGAGDDGRVRISESARDRDVDDARDVGSERGVTGRPAREWEDAVKRLDAAFAVAAARRRRFLMVLLVTTVAVVVGVYLGPVPAWGPAIAGSLLVWFLLSARRAAVEQAGRRAELRRRLRARVPASVEEPEPVEAGPLLAEDGKRVAVLDVPEGLEEPAEDTWEPVDVPLPTYMTKAKAPRVARKIDLSVPGSWTSGRLEPTRSFDLPSHPPAASAEDVDGADDSAAEAEAEEMSENRRAVGE